MATRYFGTQPVRIDAESECFGAEAECQARCDALNAVLAENFRRKEAENLASYAAYGYYEHEVSSWDYTYYIVNYHISDGFWHPWLVAGNPPW